jgi:hypothetical protein
VTALAAVTTVGNLALAGLQVTGDVGGVVRYATGGGAVAVAVRRLVGLVAAGAFHYVEWIVVAVAVHWLAGLAPDARDARLGVTATLVAWSFLPDLLNALLRVGGFLVALPRPAATPAGNARVFAALWETTGATLAGVLGPAMIVWSVLLCWSAARQARDVPATWALLAALPALPPVTALLWQLLATLATGLVPVAG